MTVARAGGKTRTVRVIDDPAAKLSTSGGRKSPLSERTSSTAGLIANPQPSNSTNSTRSPRFSPMRRLTSTVTVTSPLLVTIAVVIPTAPYKIFIPLL